MKLHIKKGDNVKVLSGKYKNKTGVVLRVFPKTLKAIVEGVNMIKKHMKSNESDKKGSVVVKEAPINICKLMYYDVKSGISSRVGRKIDENGKMRRYLKKTNSFI